MKKRFWLNYAAVFGAFLVVVFFFTGAKSLTGYVKGGVADVPGAFIVSCIDFLPWALFTPLIVWLLHRFPLQKKDLRQSLGVHFLAALFFSLLKNFLYVWYVYYGKPYGPPSFGAYLVYFLKLLPWNVLYYTIIVGVFYILDYSRRAREREIQATKLEAQLSKAQLDVLKMQLHPHFLFNTLHAISALVRDNPDAADLMIGRLSDLLRLSLENRDRHHVPLKEELDFLKIYLEIETTRFQDRLRVHLEIDPETLDVLVPNLILQPLAENAIRHGIAPRKEGGDLSIRAAMAEGKLCLEVADNGNGLDPAKSKKTKKGIGLTNTRERLRQMYGESHRFVVKNGSERGVRVIIELPVDRGEALPPIERDSE